MFCWVNSQYHLGTHKLTQGKWLSGDHSLLAESSGIQSDGEGLAPASYILQSLDSRMSILPQLPRVASGKIGEV